MLHASGDAPSFDVDLALALGLAGVCFLAFGVVVAGRDETGRCQEECDSEEALDGEHGGRYLLGQIRDGDRLYQMGWVAAIAGVGCAGTDVAVRGEEQGRLDIAFRSV